MVTGWKSAVNRDSVNKVQSALTPEDIANTKAQEAAQAALVARLRNVHATGRVVLEIPPNAEQLKDLPDLVLEDGDRLMVPPKPPWSVYWGWFTTKMPSCITQARAFAIIWNSPAGRRAMQIRRVCICCVRMAQ